MNPVWKDNKLWKLIHPLPWNLFSHLNIFDHFKSLWPFAHCIGGVAGPAEFDVGYSCGAISFNIPVAESTVQTSCLFVVDMIEEDGLIDRNPGINWKDGKEEAFGLNLKSMVGNRGKKKYEYNNKKKGEPLLHIYNLYLRKSMCQVKSVKHDLLDLNRMQW
jgi:hypothetical protein